MCHGFVRVDRSLYTIRAVPFTDVRSIRRYTRTFGWQYIIVVLSSGIYVIFLKKAVIFSDRGCRVFNCPKVLLTS